MSGKRDLDTEGNKTSRKLWEQSPVGCLVVDTCGGITAVNQTGRRLFDKTGRTLLNERLSTLVAPEDSAAVEQLLARALKSGNSEKQEIRLTSASGRVHVCLLELKTLEDSSGREQVQAVLTDISERKQAEQQLEKSEQEKNAILDNLLEHVVYQDEDMKILWANRAACESVQTARENILGRHCYEVWSKRRSPCEDCPVIKARVTGQHQVVEKTTPDGRWWHIQSFPVRDSEGHANGAAEVTLDITDRKRAEEALRKAKDDLELRVAERTKELADTNEKLTQEIEDRKRTETDLRLKEIDLRESEEFSTSLLAHAPNPIIVFHPDSSIKYVNPALEKLTGFSAAESIGKKVPYPWWLPDDVDLTRREFEQALQIGLNRFEKCFQTKNGVPFWVEITFNKVKSNGELKYYLANWVDITERKRTEAALRDSEATARALLNAPGDVVVLLDTRGIVIEANAALGREFKKSPEELRGRSILDLFPPELARQRKSYLDQAVRSGRPVQFEDERDGKWWDSIVYPVKDDHAAVTRVAVVSRNVTQRKAAEDLLKVSEERYRAVVDHLAIGIALISPDMEILTLNQQMKQWFPHIDPSLRPFCYRSFFRHPRQGICDYCPTIQTLRDGGVHESVIERAKGDKVRYYRLVASPVKDFQDNIVSSIMMVEDISDRKWSEEQIQNLSHRLVHAQEAERRMLASELHDSVAQDLSAIKISVETLFDRQAPWPPETREKITKLAAAIKQSIATVRNLSYGLRPPGLSEIGLPRVLAAYCEEFAEDQHLVLDFQASGFKNTKLDSFVEINLYRLVQEGLTNIRKHARAERVAVKLLRAPSHIILRIEDDGKGFDVQNRAPGLEAEKRLGLRSMQDRVNLLQGDITITSKKGKGTRLFIKIPDRQDRIGSQKTHPQPI